MKFSPFKVRTISKSLQVWGTEEVDGIKRFTRRIFFIGGKGKKITARIIYDYREQI